MHQPINATPTNTTPTDITPILHRHRANTTPADIANQHRTNTTPKLYRPQPTPQQPTPHQHHTNRVVLVQCWCGVGCCDVGCCGVGCCVGGVVRCWCGIGWRGVGAVLGLVLWFVWWWEGCDAEQHINLTAPVSRTVFKPDRKSGIPVDVETPAPVKAIICWLSLTHRASSLI